jgi:hypothetical protein
MRKLLVAAALAILCFAAVPSLSGAAVSHRWDRSRISFGLSPAAILPASMSTRPPGFPTNAGQAVATAKTSPVMRALHAREHPLQVQPVISPGGSRGSEWVVQFGYHNRLVAEVEVSPAGRLLHTWTGPQAIARYTRGNYAPLFDSAWVVIPFSLFFLVLFLDPRRLRRLVHLDALVLMSLLVSYWLFDHEHLAAAVWLVYPPLLYLLVRMIVIGVRGRRGSMRLAPMLSTRVLAIGLLALVIARVVLSFVDHTMLDVGYASVIGAYRIAHGLPIYWSGAQHGDTYGPITYLAYLPFELLSPWRGTFGYLLSARLAAVAFDLITIAGLMRLGVQLRPGTHGRRLGLALAWAWAACPFTLLGLMMHTNDGLVAMLSVLALVAFSAPAARGALLGLAAAAKFTPAALLPLFASRNGRGLKGTAIAIGSFLLVVVAAIGVYLPPGGLHEFYDHTLGFQLNRVDVFSAWALHPGLAPLKLAVEGGAILLAGAVAFFPRQRTLVQVCALAAAVTIAVQLPAIHWFYYYVIWFAPFAFVVLLTPFSRTSSSGELALDARQRDTRAERELVAA